MGVFTIYSKYRQKMEKNNTQRNLKEDLAVWFGKKKKPKGSKQPKGPWVNICRKVDGKHPPCGRKSADEGGYPKCRAAGVAGKMSAAEKKAACGQKRRAEKKDTQTGKGQKPIMTSYKKKNESVYRLTKLVLEKFKVSPSEYLKLHEDSDVVLVIPNSHMASCKYGANTKWCTTNRNDDELFDEHYSSGVLGYIIIKNKELAEEIGGQKFALYKQWGNTPTIVYDEKNIEHLDGESWIINEFDKSDNEKLVLKLLILFNKYYEALTQGMTKTSSFVKENNKPTKNKNNEMRHLIKSILKERVEKNDMIDLGTMVELEHTDSKKIAEKIALDHLNQNPRYYCVLFRIGLIDEEDALQLASKICPSI